jgi:hypothetical protein
MRVLQAVAAALSASLAAIAASQSPGAAGNLTLVTGSTWPAATGPLAFTANEPSTQASGDFQGGIQIANNVAAILNPPRTVAITSASATTNAGINVTVTGFDRVGLPISETITGPAGNATVTTARLFAVVTQIAVSGAATSIEAGWDGSSYSRWINLANRRGHYQHKIIVLSKTVLSNTQLFIQYTSMAMSKVAGVPAGQTAYAPIDDTGLTWNGGDYPDDVESVGTATATNNGNGTFTDSVTTDNADPWAYVRIKVVAGQNTQVVLRVIPTRTA